MDCQSGDVFKQLQWFCLWYRLYMEILWYLLRHEHVRMNGTMVIIYSSGFLIYLSGSYRYYTHYIRDVCGVGFFAAFDDYSEQL